MSPVAAALLGVVVGAAVNHILARLLDRRRDRRVVVGAARLLFRDVMMFALALHEAIAEAAWPPPNSGARLRLENWQRLAPDLSAAMASRDDFEDVCLAFESLEDLLSPPDGSPPLEVEHLKRILERDAMGAADVLGRLQSSPRARVRSLAYRVRRALRRRRPPEIRTGVSRS
jgi:hypothetical protein